MSFPRFLMAGTLALILATGSAAAQGKTFVLAADERLEASGVLKFLVPRFALKYQIRPTVVAGADDAAALYVAPPDVAGDGGVIVFHRSGSDPEEVWSAAVRRDAEGADHAETFRDWLLSDIGRAMLETFQEDGAQVFLPGKPSVDVVVAPVIEGDANQGERLALVHCGRCHVVSEKNRMGGIGSTPSFAALRAIPGWEDKFLAFWSANPHPSFTQVEGLTEPFDPARPPHIAPVEITMPDIDAITAYAASIEPKDLGAPVGSR